MGSVGCMVALGSTQINKNAILFDDDKPMHHPV